ncbi:MAG: hypothetical protein JNK53_01355, partial [Phycisphaerae bacterium]|nr:hypothetical protein [Phycisphaerae bacterium]
MPRAAAFIRTAVIALACALAASLARPVIAQVEGVPITGDRLGGFVLPIEPGKWNARFKSTRANAWKVDSTQRLYLDGQVNVQLGPYDFYAEQAVVWVERIPSERGVITQIAVWFPVTSEPTKSAGLGASGTNLLITASTLGEATLSVVLPDTTAPRANTTLKRGELRLASYLRKLADNPPPLRSLPEVRRPTPLPPPPPIVIGGSVLSHAQQSGKNADGSVAAVPAEPVAVPPADLDAAELEDAALDRAASASDRSPVIAPDSLLAFVADSLEIDTKADVVTLKGGTTLDVIPRNPGANARMLQMRAERAVIFLKPGTCAGLGSGASQVDADAVQGIYLEGDVTGTDFDYTVRAKRAYYDFAANRATLIEGVLRTRDRKGIALIARADELRQYSQEQWQADKVVVSTSEFFTPHLSVGVERATITRTLDDSDGTSASYAQGQ